MCGVNEEEDQLTFACVLEYECVFCACSNINVLVNKLDAISILHLYPNANCLCAVVCKLHGEYRAACRLVCDPDIDVAPRILSHISIRDSRVVYISICSCNCIVVFCLELNVEICVIIGGSGFIGRLLGEANACNGNATAVRCCVLGPACIDEEVKHLSLACEVKGNGCNLACRYVNLFFCKSNSACSLKLNSYVNGFSTVVNNVEVKCSLTSCLILNPGVNVLICVCAYVLVSECDLFKIAFLVEGIAIITIILEVFANYGSEIYGRNVTLALFSASLFFALVCALTAHFALVLALVSGRYVGSNLYLEDVVRACKTCNVVCTCRFKSNFVIILCILYGIATNGAVKCTVDVNDIYCTTVATGNPPNLNCGLACNNEFDSILNVAGLNATCAAPVDSLSCRIAVFPSLAATVNLCLRAVMDGEVTTDYFCFAVSLCALSHFCKISSYVKNVNGIIFLVTLALIILAAIIFACICALTADFAGALAYVSRSVTLALVSANIFCTSCICALTALFAYVLALVVTLALVCAKLVCTSLVQALAADFAKVVTLMRILFSCIENCNIVKVDTAALTSEVVCTLFGNCKLVSANICTNNAFINSYVNKCVFFKSYKTKSSCCILATGDSVNYDCSRTVCNDLDTSVNCAVDNTHSTVELKSHRECATAHILVMTFKGKSCSSGNTCSGNKLCVICYACKIADVNVNVCKRLEIIAARVAIIIVIIILVTGSGNSCSISLELYLTNGAIEYGVVGAFSQASALNLVFLNCRAGNMTGSLYLFLSYENLAAN